PSAGHRTTPTPALRAYPPHKGEGRTEFAARADSTSPEHALRRPNTDGDARGNHCHARARGNWREVLAAFLRLGLTSFGGPVAHLGYFREEFVHPRRRARGKRYAQLGAALPFLAAPRARPAG